MGTHMIINFYLHPKIDPKDYGFEERENSRGREKYWYLHFGHQNSAIIIDGVTRKIHCNGISTKLMSVLFKIAEKGGIEIEDGDDPKKPIRMSLTEEEYLEVQRMRNHPKEEEE